MQRVKLVQNQVTAECFSAPAERQGTTRLTLTRQLLYLGGQPFRHLISTGETPFSLTQFLYFFGEIRGGLRVRLAVDSALILTFCTRPV
jgi:hypothetical protein